MDLMTCCDDIVLDRNEPDPSTTSARAKKRSSKAVRQRKKLARRVVLNEFCVQRMQKSFKIDVVEIDGQDVDFTDVFAFYTWYLDNYARFEDDIPKDLVMKFKEQYLALNIDEEGKQFLIDSIRHKTLFEDCGYEKTMNSDSDESVYNEQHKTDVSSPLSSFENAQPCPSPRPMSPILCDDVIDDQSDSSNEEDPPVLEFMDCSDGYVVPTPLVDVVSSGPRVLYKDYGSRVLTKVMTEEDYRQINNIKKSMITNTNCNVKIRYKGLTLHLNVKSIWNFCPNGVEPLISSSLCAWSSSSYSRSRNILGIAIKPGIGHIAHVVNMD